MPDDHKLQPPASSDFLARIRERTPARVLVERAGAAYRTSTQLELRRAHAAARDAVATELDMQRDLGAEFVREWKLFEVATKARSKDEYLLRPDLGRQLSEDAVEKIKTRCARGVVLQIVVGDGLSVTAVAAQVSALLPLIAQKAVLVLHEERTGGQGSVLLGQPFVVRHCRVGVMNQIGELLHPQVVVLLIGERPGLATAESLSAYMAFSPRAGDTDAQRNLISNIHARGVKLEEAAERIVRLAAKMIAAQRSGVAVKEELPPARWIER
jgi:ethanolamine ammonia-lyase small subunit